MALIIALKRATFPSEYGIKKSGPVRNRSLEIILFERLLSDAELCNKSSVTLDINFCKIVKDISSLTNHHEKSSSAVVVALVCLEVFCEVIQNRR